MKYFVRSCPAGTGSSDKRQLPIINIAGMAVQDKCENMNFLFRETVGHMILSGLHIKENLGRNIVIEPFSENQLNPNSYNLRLHNELVVYDDAVLDMKRNNPTRRMSIPDDGLLLNPGQLYLGRTVEYTATDGFVPMLEGRSSIGRLGLSVHITAGFGDVGFNGYWTLEIHCIQPVKIYPFVEICQIYYHTIEGPYQQYSSRKYQNSTDIRPSRIYQEFDRK